VSYSTPGCNCILIVWPGRAGGGGIANKSAYNEKVANCQNCGQGTLSPALIEVSHIRCEIHHQVGTLAQAQQTTTTIHLDVNNAKV